MSASKERTPADREHAMRIGLVFAKRPWPGFEWAVQEYRQIEAEIIASAHYDDFLILELRRRIAEWIVKAADRDDVPLQQFQAAWNDLLALGFTDIEKKGEMLIYHAEYCLNNEHYDEGLAALEPAIAEYETWLQSAVLEPKLRTFFEEHLGHMKFRHEGLLALRAGGAAALDWLARDEARGPSSHGTP